MFNIFFLIKLDFWIFLVFTNQCLFFNINIYIFYFFIKLKWRLYFYLFGSCISTTTFKVVINDSDNFMYILNYWDVLHKFLNKFVCKFPPNLFLHTCFKRKKISMWLCVYIELLEFHINFQNNAFVSFLICFLLFLLLLTVKILINSLAALIDFFFSTIDTYWLIVNVFQYHKWRVTSD